MPINYVLSFNVCSYCPVIPMHSEKRYYGAKEITEEQPGFMGVLKPTFCPLMESVWSLESSPPEVQYTSAKLQDTLHKLMYILICYISGDDTPVLH